MNTMWNSSSWLSDPDDVCQPTLGKATLSKRALSKTVLAPPVLAPPILALHGSASTGGLWQGTADYLRGRHRVIAPELSRHGAKRTAHHSADIASAILGAMAEPMHLVGHGHGAAIALEIALLRPDLAKSLTLIEPALFCCATELRRTSPC